MAVPPNLDGNHFRARAEECRAIADMFHSAETRDRMLKVAAGYERMALSADRFQSDIAELRHGSDHDRGAPAPGGEHG